jgi:hypothetical protein
MPYGYRVDDYPRLITDVQTALAPRQNYNATPVIQQALAERHLLPAEQFADAAYISLSRPVKNLTLLQHLVTAAAINVKQAVNWLSGVPLAQTRQSHFAALMA